MTITDIVDYLITLPKRLRIRKECAELVKKCEQKHAHIEDERERAKWVLENFKRHCYEEIWRRHSNDCLTIFEEERSRTINQLAKVIFSEK